MSHALSAGRQSRSSRIDRVDGKLAQAGKDRGFTIIELLVVMAIIGLLAAIAIPVFSKLKNNAYDSAAQSDMRQVALQVESVFTSTGSYPAAVPGNPTPALSTLPASVTANLKITNPSYLVLNYKVATNGQGYVIASSDNRTPNLYCLVSTLGGQRTLTTDAASCLALLTT